MSSTSLFGVLGEFDPSTELFVAYLERLEQFFIANSIGQCSADASQEVIGAEDKKKVAVFISVVISLYVEFVIQLLGKSY